MGVTSRHDLPYPEATDPPAGHTQIRSLAETLDPLLSRIFETLINIPSFTGLASGGVVPGTPITIPFTGAGFTAPPRVILMNQNLPSGSQFVRPAVTAISATSCQVFAYNISHQTLNMGGALSVALIAIER